MTIQQFIEEYSNYLTSGNAAYFVGAGISTPSNLPQWDELLKPHALRIGISNLDNRDLPRIAQYVINEETGNRGPLINAISRKLRRKFSPNSYHESIVRTNIKTIWTTNYDNLLEVSYGNQRIEVKINDDSISRETNEEQVEIIKMHGCIFNSHRDDIVITQSDYEDFSVRRPATAQRLRMDLLQKSFLFIGYGYSDPNIQNIITEARRLTGNNTRQHFLITKTIDGPEFIYWCNNLRRYGIRVIPIASYSELDVILGKLSLRSRGKSVFITGSHETKNDGDIRAISEALAMQDDIVLNDGQSTGVMRIATQVFMEKVIERKSDIARRLKFYANPYAANSRFTNDISLIPMLKQWRLPLFKATHIVIAFDGKMGTEAEMEKALELGCIVIPFLKKKNGELWKMLDNPSLQKQLAKFDDQYLIKVRNGKVKTEDVIMLVQSIFASN